MSADLPSEYWLYLSGGGLRAALGSIGTLLELRRVDPQYWSKVTRVVSVSGGSLTNAVLAGLGPEDDPDEALRGLYHRITDRAGPWMWRTVLNILLCLVGVVAFDRLLDRVGVPSHAWFSVALLALTVRRWVRWYQRDRIRHIVGPTASRRLKDLVVRHDATHVFSTSSALSGGTVYFGVRRNHARMITDLGVASGYFDRDVADHDTVLDLVDAGSLFPVLRQPWFRSGSQDPRRSAHVRRQVRAAGRRAGRSVDRRIQKSDGVLLRQEPTGWRPPKRPEPMQVQHRGRVSPDLLWDGGVNGLFASRLDPRMYHSSNDGISMIIEALDDPTPDPDPTATAPGTASVPKRQPNASPPTEDVRRVVTDAGQWMRPMRSFRWVLRIPVVGMLAAAHRAIKLSLNGLVGVDRELATLLDNLYVPITGSSAVFLMANGNEGRWVMPTGDERTDPVVDRIVTTKARAERLGLMSGGEYAFDCVLAGAIGVRIHPLAASSRVTIADLDRVGAELARALGPRKRS